MQMKLRLQEDLLQILSQYLLQPVTLLLRKINLILLRKIVVTNNPEDPRVNGELYIAVIKEPSSGFWVFNIQNTIKDIKNLIMNIDLQSIVNKIKQSFG